MPRKWLFASLFIGVALGILAGASLMPRPADRFGALLASERAPLRPTIALTTGAPGIDPENIEASAWEIDPEARVFILPHHAVAARGITSLVSSIHPPKTVVLLAPDHFSRGKTIFTTTYADFRLPSGATVKIDQEKTSEYVRLVDPLRDDHTVIAQEHGITALIPFFAKAWPKTKIVPVAVRADADPRQLKDFAALLVQELRTNPDVIVIGSIDFSHYLPAEVADFHDVLAEDVIRTLDVESAEKVEADSPHTLSIVLQTARESGLGRATVHAHTNSLRILQAKLAQDSTSHLFVSFAPGERAASEATTFLLMGDLMFDRNVANRSKKAVSLAYPFAKIRGQEDRFFWGQDLVIGNLEGSLSTKRRPPEKSIDFWFDPAVKDLLKSLKFDAVSLANNHALDQGREGMVEAQKFLNMVDVRPFGDQVKDDPMSSLEILERRGKRIALIGFNTTDNPLDRKEASASLKKAQDERVDYTIVFMHWGAEYQAKPGKNEVELAHWLIDQGVDVVIGGHPHWMQSVEYYKGKPIAYSLGNFIFDQDWSEETGLGLVVGLVLRPTGSETHLFPIQMIESQPRLLTGDARQKRLDRLAEISDPTLAGQIRQGVIKYVK